MAATINTVFGGPGVVVGYVPNATNHRLYIKDGVNRGGVTH